MNMELLYMEVDPAGPDRTPGTPLWAGSPTPTLVDPMRVLEEEREGMERMERKEGNGGGEGEREGEEDRGEETGRESRGRL
jgi:hypothetical protein